MFEDFRLAALSVEGRRRERQSLAAAAFLYGGFLAGVVANTAATATTIQRIDQDDLIFVPRQLLEDPPAAEPAPPAAAPASTKPTPRIARPKPPAPTSVEVPGAALEESDEELAGVETGDPGEGVLGGVKGGTGTVLPLPAPPKAVGPTRLARPLASNEVKYTKRTREKGIQGVVVVEFDVSETGIVRNLRVVSGAPELVEMVLKWVPTWRFQPALKDGKAVSSRMTKTIRFRLDDP